MKYLSIDIETTGIDPERNQILSIGAVIEDTNNPKPLDDLPAFHGVIKRWDISGSMFAINLNKELIDTIVSYQTADREEVKLSIEAQTGMSFYEEDEIVEAFYRFLFRNGMVELDGNIANREFVMDDGIRYPKITSKMKKVHLTCAGKNFATFDKLFLEKLPRWKQVFSIRQRVLDPAILFTEWDTDDSPPGLSECKRRAGLPAEVSHNAVEDAKDVISLLRIQYRRSKKQ